MITKISGDVPEHEYYLNDKLTGEIILIDTKKIEQYAFHFTEIDKINLEDVKYIGGSAFAYTKIKQANLQNIVQLMCDAFASCDYLSEVFIGDKLAHIGNGCFKNCLKLKKVELPDTVVSIDRCAFQNSGIVSFSVPPCIKRLNDSVFINCRSLEHLDLKNVEIINENAIANTAIKELELPSTFKVLKHHAISRNKQLTKITIPATIEEIQQDALSENFALEEIIFKGNRSDLSKIKGFDKFYEEYSDIIKIEPLSLDDILKNMHNHKKDSINEIEEER